MIGDCSILIKDQGVFSIKDGIAQFSVNDNVNDPLQLAESQLEKEKASRSPNEQHIKILSSWIKLFNEQLPLVQKELVYQTQEDEGPELEKERKRIQDLFDSLKQKQQEKKMPLDPKVKAKVDEALAFSKALSKPAKYNEVLQAYPGDPLVGQVIQTTDLLWELATESQKFIYTFYLEGSGTAGSSVLPPDFPQIISDNKGEDAPYNWSYADFGLVPGQPAKVKITEAIVRKTGVVVEVVEF